MHRDETMDASLAYLDEKHLNEDQRQRKRSLELRAQKRLANVVNMHKPLAYSSMLECLGYGCACFRFCLL